MRASQKSASGLCVDAGQSAGASRGTSHSTSAELDATSPLGIVKSQAYPTAVLTNQLQAKAKIPLLVGADFERGAAMRLDEGTSFPTAMALAAAGNPEDAYTMGKITTLEARAVGIQWIYAPDADVNNNPGNPIINTRSFGEDPAKVAEYVKAFVRGVEENGGLATAKHFPGHGDTTADSHIDLPTIPASRERLEKLELIPFRAAISAGVSSVMTGHLSVPALEPDPNTPATLSTHRQWKPIDIMLRLAAVCTTVPGESTIMVTTSTPLSASALTASASFAGSTTATV